MRGLCCLGNGQPGSAAEHSNHGAKGRKRATVRSEVLEMENSQRQPCSYTWASVSMRFGGQTPSEGDCSCSVPLRRAGGGVTAAC